MRLCVDASVAIKWVVEEPDSRAANQLLEGELVAPDLVLVEAANVLWQRTRRLALPPSQATDAMAGLRRFFAEIYPVASLIDRALAISLELDHPVYDALYLALARDLGVPLVTADRRLVAACAGTAFEPLVRPLVAPPPTSTPPPPAPKRRQR